MVSEHWIPKMRNQDSSSPQSTTAAAKKKESKPSPELNVVGILSFEVASAMSKIIHLHKSLSASQISRLHGEVLKSHGVRNLKLDDLDRAAAVVSRLGKRCNEPALVGFEHVYADLLRSRVEMGKLGLPAKDMEGTIRKMERYVSSTASLYAELEVLNELEQGARKFLPSQYHEETRRAFEQKIQWQRHDVRHLRDVSVWNQTFDKIVSLMARAVCAIHSRMRLIFGRRFSPKCGHRLSGRFVSGQLVSGRRRVPPSGAVAAMPQRKQVGALRVESLRLPCGPSPARLFAECLSLAKRGSSRSRAPMSGPFLRGRPSKQRTSIPKNGLAARAAPSSVGGSALALHYANVIIIIEKLLQYPHLVGEEARDDLYQMLPTSLRSSLRKTLRSYIKDLAIYDAPWLMTGRSASARWQTERNFEQQQIGPRGSVLLLQTLFFADREKTEAAICELLVGLNYICRYEHQQSALLDCSSSLDFEDCADWQL
ncbi:unnamed protein product [Spirodela intermedia]|uniref:Uncharacterized protein n=1 Tax=Spirodela intermedia TaxID=51605 RepID=A0A7I8J8X7_SPIIN|nr:unnamed protein product [Spirodela intermedia]CAA6666539.1 unnamed protein product [Spirodela intermedia]